jgi:hypothetical protein
MCQSASAKEVEPAPSDKIEEIIVYGDKSLRRLRNDVYKAEQKVIVIFNSLNSDDEFDIHCTRDAPTGSHIKRRVCRANFVGKATAHEARGFMLGQPYIPAWATIPGSFIRPFPTTRQMTHGLGRWIPKKKASSSRSHDRQ